MIGVLGLIYTLKCNAECNLCCFSCGPKREDKMDKKDAFRYIQEASKVKGIKTVSLTGGECLLYYEEILEVVNYAKSLGFNVTITTNGYWANTREKTLAMMKRMKEIGVIKLSVSCDEFHQEYIPIENIKNILSSSKEVGIGVELGSILTKNSRGLEKLLPILGDDAMNVMIIQSPCLPVGRAKEKIGHNEFIYKDKVPAKTCENLNTLAIFPNGDSYPCCSQSGMTPALYLGNTKELSVLDLIKQFRQNMHCRILEREGLDWYLSYIEENQLDIEVKDRYINDCDLCNTLLKNEKQLSLFKDGLLEEKRKIVAEIMEREKLTQS